MNFFIPEAVHYIQIFTPEITGLCYHGFVTEAPGREGQADDTGLLQTDVTIVHLRQGV